MGHVCMFVSLLCVAVASGIRPLADSVDSFQNLRATDDDINDTELKRVFVIFRHGDRTPDEEELAFTPTIDYTNIFFPYGPKALTNKGKERAYYVGLYLRTRYNGLLSSLYLPEEITVRTTDYARTKMTALAALAGLYPPQQVQKWHPHLAWQPIPYNTLPFDEDDLLYYYNCPRYLWVRDQVYDLPEMQEKIKPYTELMHYLSEHSKSRIKTTEDVFFMDNLFKALDNVGMKIPRWAAEVMPRIKEVTKIEYAAEFYNSEAIRLASGVLMGEIQKAMASVVSGSNEGPKMRVYSAHENNVAGLMAASRVFVPHQPPYGATFSLELRRKPNGEFVVAAVYTQNVGPTATVQILPIDGCGGKVLCDFDTFMALVSEYAWTKHDYKLMCPKKF
ncbi:venom acid phosphatase Acph-1-like [Pectinophora gossypiella]|uniref:venom acid phosphatase Acph-1-like n=1 Tax=Pectinophora gossypiella TaxID=13191 RepID=UPI00214EA31A|nr:venom acid phosphatase Acph-1-like [Pectinophora gossypiella]